MRPHQLSPFAHPFYLFTRRLVSIAKSSIIVENASFCLLPLLIAIAERHSKSPIMDLGGGGLNYNYAYLIRRSQHLCCTLIDGNSQQGFVDFFKLLVDCVRKGPEYPNAGLEYHDPRV